MVHNLVELSYRLAGNRLVQQSASGPTRGEADKTAPREGLYEGIKVRAKDIPEAGSTRIPDALDRLIELSAATDKPDEVAKWQAERAKYPEPAPKPEGGK